MTPASVSTRVSHLSPGGGFRRRFDPFHWAMALPAMVALTLVLVVPILRALYLSFTNYDLIDNMGAPEQTVGLANYIRLLTDDPLFLISLWNTVAYTAGSVGLAFAGSLALALLLNSVDRFRGPLRGLALIPWVVPTAVTSMLWLLVFNPRYGILDATLQGTGLTNEPLNVLSNLDLAMPGLVLVTAWKTLPFFTLMILAALQTVPREVVEAAQIDGASSVSVFRFITIRHIRPQILVMLLLGIVWGFQQFGITWILTQGGPLTRTTTLSVFIYKSAFRTFDMGYAAAAGFVGLAILAVFAFVVLRLLRER
ncbi:MAG: carbohydrate ABC transporter permease [Candidatus Limnocylindria bacterium]